jgi:hypothetical protein
VQAGSFAVLLLIALNIEPADAVQREVRAIVSATPAEFRDVEFEGEAVLLGFRIDEFSGGLELRVAWRKLEGQSRIRFLHVYDGRGTMTGQGTSGRAAFARARAGEELVETVVVRRHAIRDGESLAIGFWSKDSGFARALFMGQSVDRLHIAGLEPYR